MLCNLANTISYTTTRGRYCGKTWYKRIDQYSEIVPIYSFSLHHSCTNLGDFSYHFQKDLNYKLNVKLKTYNIRD